MLTYLSVMLGGALGTGARFWASGLIAPRQGEFFPLGTLVVNVLGSFVLGLLTGLQVTGDALLRAGTATLGSFTTFSTWMLETERLGEDGETRLAGANLAASVAAGLLAALSGWALGAVL